MISRASFVGAALLLATSCATLSLPWAGTRSVPNVPQQLELYRLANGARVVVDHRQNSPLVSVVSLVSGGGVSDPLGREGLSHVVAHASLRAHTSLGLPYARALEQLGVAQVDVHSTFDTTALEATSSEAVLARWLPLELERLAHPLDGVTEADFALTKEIVRNELRERREMVEGADFEWIQRSVFPAGHPYHRPVLGTHESLDALTLEDAKRYVAAAWTPQNMVLYVSGDVDSRALEALALQPLTAEQWAQLSPVPPSPVVEAPTPESLPTPVLVEHTATVATPRLYLVWQLPPGYGQADAMMRLAAELAPHAMAPAVRYDEDLTSSLSAQVVLGAQGSLLIVSADLYRGSNPGESLEALLNYVFGLAHPGGNGAVAERTMELRLNGYARALRVVYLLESPLLRARVGAADLALAGRLDPLERRVQQDLSLKPEAQDRLMWDWVSRSRARAVLVRPAQSSAALAERPATAPATPPAAIAPSPETLAQVAPRLEATERKLENGLRVVVVPRPGWPVASVSLVFPGGAATGPVGAAEYATHFSEPLFVTYGRPGNFGLRASHAFEPDVQRFSYQGKAENLPNMLAQLSTAISTQVVHTQDQEWSKLYLYRYLRRVDQLPDTVAERELSRTLLPDSVLGRRAVTEDLEKIDTSAVAPWLNDAPTPDGAVLVVVGDVTPERGLELARTWLGGWKGHPAPTFSAAPLPVSRLITTERPGASQGRVELACRVGVATAKQRAAAAVLGQLLAEDVTDELREVKGVTTGAQASLELRLGHNGWVDVETLVDGRALDEAVRSFQGALSQRAAAAPSSERLARAKLGVAREEGLLQADGPTLARSLASRLARGAELAELTSSATILSTLTADEVQQAARECSATVLTSLVGDRTQLQAALPRPASP